MWSKADEFMSLVSRAWQERVAGTPMFQVVTKMKRLKLVLKDFNKSMFSDVENNASILLMALHSLQSKLREKPDDPDLIQAEKDTSRDYVRISQAKESFLAQKAKVEWLEGGDDNTAFFHATIKKRRAHYRVTQIQSDAGQLLNNPDDIKRAFEEFYVNLLGCCKEVQPVHVPTIHRGKVMGEELHALLCRAVSGKEVRQAIFSIPGTKAPGPDVIVAKF
ncbi:hypothetical protein RND81_10G030500 [Saponaria officinalis]|uniref:Uncharacterized protein n=1 Tax=Saponaria officinalis TaxID=3572 RepID=A0AAW1I086_SAPOF